MIRSMTAFGRAVCRGERRDITVELRSVNSRFLDCTVKLPRAFACLEDRVKNEIKTRAVSRAKVDLYITVEEHTDTALGVRVDTVYAAAYVRALEELRDTFGLKDDISVMNVARNPEVFVAGKNEEDPEAFYEELAPVLSQAIDGYVAMRASEGEKIRVDLEGKLQTVASYVDEIERLSEEDTVGYRDKLEARLRAILDDHAITVDENRLLTECAVWADKIAIDEELVRLRSHFSAFREIASLPEPSGRKLDFLMQEMNRETNTIGSKANNARIARLVVNVKGELEKMREQIQNIE